MSSKAILSIETDQDTMESISTLFHGYGISVSDAVNMFFKTALYDNKLPLELTSEKYRNELYEALEEIEDIKKNPHLYKSYDNLDEFFEDLYNADEV